MARMLDKVSCEASGRTGWNDLHLLSVPDARYKVTSLLSNFVADLVVRLQQHLNLCVVILSPDQVVRLLGEVHSGKVVVRFEELLYSVSHEFDLLLERANLLGKHEQYPELVAVDIVLQLAENTDHWCLDRLKLGLELRRDRVEHSFEGSELVRQTASGGSLLLLQLPLQVIHEGRLWVGSLGAIDVEK
jgi:hypothetical protein